MYGRSEELKELKEDVLSLNSQLNRIAHILRLKCGKYACSKNCIECFIQENEDIST